MYFLANASPPKPSDVALQTLQVYTLHNAEDTDQCFMLFCPTGQGKKCIFFCKCISFYIVRLRNFQFYRCIDHMVKRTQSQDQCIDFLVNESPPKPLYIAVT